ncbi:MAG: response regulator [Edaphobacter sp.]
MATKLMFDVVPLAEVPKDDATSTRTRPVILVADDEKVIADTLSIILSKSGFDTFTAYDGTSALTLALEITPDLLISDVVMPGMSGIDLAIAVSGCLPQCKVLLFSGQAATVDLLEQARLSGHDFTTLAKPIHPTDMLRRISECLSLCGTNSEPSAMSMEERTPAPIHLSN